MQLKNPLVFGLMAVLLIGGTVLPAMSQTTEDVSQLELNLDKPVYDLNEKIIISGQILDFVKNTRDPTLDLVKITFEDSYGRTISAGMYGVNSAGVNDHKEPLVFTVSPDEAGNFEIITSLNSVLFDYGSYTVEASSYQSGKISGSSEFTISPVEEEEEVIDQETIEFELCNSTKKNANIASIMRDYKSGLDVIDCTENYNFSPADKLVVKGKINYDDSANTYRGSAEQNNEASTAQSTKRVSFVYITIPYANDMIVDTEVHTDSSVGAEDSDTQKRINELNYKVLPESNGEFVGIFELPQTLFTSGLYPVTVLYDAPGKTTSLEKTLRIIDTSIPIGAEPELIIMTDKNEYKLGEIVQISGQIQNTYTHDTVTITLTTPDISEYNCLEIECLVDVNETKIIPEPGLTAHAFSWNYQLGPNSASIGKYIVSGATTIGTAEASFFVTEESEVTQGTPTAKKVIDKFNRISDSSILISLDQNKIQDSELTPRVIQGSLFTAARGQEADVNIQVSSSNGACIIGQDSSCMVTDSTRKPGAIYDIVTIDETDYKIRYSGPSNILEKFSILPESTDTAIDIQDWNVEIIKDDQPTRFYYKISYVNLE